MASSVTPTQSATDNHLGALAPQKTIALLSIGTELTRGEIENKNAVWLSQTLIDLGHEVTEIVTIDDDDGRIIDTLKRLGSAHAAIITTGGLGPTTDDRTTTCVAQVLGVPLVRDPHSMARIFELFRSHGREPSPSNQKQAYRKRLPRPASEAVPGGWPRSA